MKLVRLVLISLLSLTFEARTLAQATPAPADSQDLPQSIPAPAPGSPSPAAAATVPTTVPPPLVLSRPMVTRAQRLGTDLAALERRGRGRVASGFIQLGVGAVFATLGAVMGNEIGRSLLLLVGAGAMAHGTLQLTLLEDAAEPSRAYDALPVFTPQQLAERVRYGEEALRRIARGARRGRIAEGVVTMTVAASYVPLLWWLERRSDPSYRFGDSAFDYVGLALSGINFASGLVTAIVSSDAERRLRSYEALRASLAAEPPASAPALSLHVGALRAGASLSGRLRF